MSTPSRDPISPTVENGLRFETERVATCPLCGSTETEAWRSECRDWQQPGAPGRFSYDRCTACRAHFLAVRPTEADARHVYFASYGPYRAKSDDHHTRRGSRVGGAALRLLDRRLARWLERTYTPESEHETLLDYGCGAPAFLDQGRARGFTTVGVDFVEEVTQAVRASGHEGLLAGKEFERGVSSSSLGCVRMNHVIEHLYNPRGTLHLIHSKMRPGGRIHISTPNPASLGSMIFRRRWHALDCPRHLILYEPRVLCRLVQEIGFEDVSVVQEVGPKDLTRSWGIVRYDNGRISHEQIENMAFAPIPAGLMLPVASLAALLGRADRYHAFARRT
jgi:2-polyprenyl-3-methyl-5-hydroxy-6-metoxy-1,4-benzoquinol methylase